MKTILSSLVIFMTSSFMMLLFVSMVMIANAPTAVAADYSINIPTDTLYGYNDWPSSTKYNLSTLLYRLGNNSEYHSNQITRYGPDLTSVEFNIMLPPKNFSKCTAIGNYNYSGNYDANTLLRSNSNVMTGNNVATGLIFYDIQVNRGLNCSFNEIIYNVCEMFDVQQLYLLFPYQYKNQFQNEIHLASGPINQLYQPLPTILFLPDSKIESTELKVGNIDVEDRSYNTYYLMPTYNTNPTYYGKKVYNFTMIFAFVGGIFAACLVLCVLMYIQDRKLKNTSSRSQGSNDSPVDLTSSSNRPPSGGDTLQQQQNIMNSVSSSVQKHKEIDRATYEAFQALPRIKYNKSYTYSKRRVFNEVNENTEEEIYLCQTGTKTTDQTGTKLPVVVASADNVVVTECSNKIVMHTPNSVSTHQLGSSNRTLSGIGNNINNNEICAICVDEFQNQEVIIRLPRCQHMYHIKCLGLWLLDQKSKICPLCKLEVFHNNNNNNNVANNENTPNTHQLPEYCVHHIGVPIGINDDDIMIDPVVLSDDIRTVPNMAGEHINYNNSSSVHHDTSSHIDTMATL